jgi:ribosomal-protein-alanine N-acetyltransferase
MLQKTGNPFGLDYANILIETQHLYVRSLRITDCAAWLKIRSSNYEYLQEREPIWDMDALTYQSYYRLVNDLMTSFSIGNYYSLGVFEKNTHQLVGGFEISNLMYWPKQSATIGYWIGKEYTGQGYATQTLANMTQWALKHFNLIKIEAGTMISNAASQKILTKVGFAKEGLSHCYGEINGIYEDHILWGITASELNTTLLLRP